MANTDFSVFLRELKKILEYGNNSGSVNLYMAHGGTNFGWTAGGRLPSHSPSPPSPSPWTIMKKGNVKHWK